MINHQRLTISIDHLTVPKPRLEGWRGRALAFGHAGVLDCVNQVFFEDIADCCKARGGVTLYSCGSARSIARSVFASSSL